MLHLFLIFIITRPYYSLCAQDLFLLLHKAQHLWTSVCPTQGKYLISALFLQPFSDRFIHLSYYCQYIYILFVYTHLFFFWSVNWSSSTTELIFIFLYRTHYPFTTTKVLLSPFQFHFLILPPTQLPTLEDMFCFPSLKFRHY